MTPIVGHPTGIPFVSERKSFELQKSRKASLIGGVLYWFKVKRRGESVPRGTWFERDERELPLSGYRIEQSGYAGPLVRQGQS